MCFVTWEKERQTHKRWPTQRSWHAQVLPSCHGMLEATGPWKLSSPISSWQLRTSRPPEVVSQANNGSARQLLRPGFWYFTQHWFSHMSQPMRETQQVGTVTRQSLWFLVRAEGLAMQTSILLKFSIGLTTPYRSQPSWLLAGPLYTSRLGSAKLTGWVALSVVWITDQPKLRHANASFINLTDRHTHKSGPPDHFLSFVSGP